MIGTRKANKKADQELTKHIDLIYPTVALVLWKEYGWRKLRITRLFVETKEVWEDCAAAGTEKSILSMLEDETGIEIRTPGMKSFHEYAYLDADAWDKKPPTKMQQIYIRQRQIKWLPAILTANICLALYRKEKWGAERIARFISYVEELKALYGANKALYYKELEEVTDFTRDEICRYKKEL